MRAWHHQRLITGNNAVVDDLSVVHHTGFVDHTTELQRVRLVDGTESVTEGSRATPAADSASRLRALATLVEPAAGAENR